MFTGIIHHQAVLLAQQATDHGKRWQIRTKFADLKQGESIAFDGACLTVAGIDGYDVWVDLSPETLMMTQLGSYENGQHLNVERALALGDRLGGHWVTGHVDGVLNINCLEEAGEYVRMVLSLPEHGQQRGYLVDKGSLTVNGVSLTINRVLFEQGIELMLIPETLKITSLGQLNVDSGVNVEYDYLAKLVSQQLQQRP